MEALFFFFIEDEKLHSKKLLIYHFVNKHFFKNFLLGSAHITFVFIITNTLNNFIYMLM